MSSVAPRGRGKAPSSDWCENCMLESWERGVTVSRVARAEFCMLGVLTECLHTTPALLLRLLLLLPCRGPVPPRDCCEEGVSISTGLCGLQPGDKSAGGRFAAGDPVWIERRSPHGYIFVTSVLSVSQVRRNSPDMN